MHQSLAPKYQRQIARIKLRHTKCSDEFLSDIFGKKVGSNFEAGLVDLDTCSVFYQAVKAAVGPKRNKALKHCKASVSVLPFMDWPKVVRPSLSCA